MPVTYLPTATPSAKQLAYQDWEFGIFLHFGIRTFHEGHRDWDGKPMDPTNFNPTALDCDQWVTTAQAAGARYMVLTAKHHDGFANWPSRYTNFSVAATPWKDGTGDVVRDFTDACHRHGMKVGLYYSPAEWGNPGYADPTAYDDYFINQVSEILTGYGTVDMLWFDGCGSENHQYDWPRIMAEVRRMQPGILIFNMGDPDYRWVGNEAGIAPQPCWNTVDAVPVSVRTDARDAVPRPTWLPAECDCMMRATNWFYSDDDVHTVKSLPQLVGMWYYSVGRGCNFLLNLGPDRRGLLPEPDATRLLELGAEIRRRFAAPIATLDDFQTLDAGWACSLPQPTMIDHVVLAEDLAQGEHARRFAIAVQPFPYGDPVVVYQGYNIGHKAICAFPPIEAQSVRIELLEADGPVNLRALEVHYVAGRG